MRITILTGAGISAESGLGTFRDAGGLWERYPIEEVATPEGFAADPGKVHAFYDMRRRDAARAEPNVAHRALAELAAARDVVVVTQNVDDLHERAGVQALHMHGSLFEAACTACGATAEWRGDMGLEARCPSCGAAALRPAVVWFGEVPRHLDAIADRLAVTDLFVAIGTSGQVWPAAGFAQEAAAHGAETLEISLEPSGGTFDEVIVGKASEAVPDWVRALL
ncbi:Sir2 family NAD-dependent protein deacetylase [Roseobacter sp. HKCCA0434]|uniref:Sir2 family NAD-dependent protein deacetylase n=1 Tax=Roseobacter sp. HKCCA0434 TaxID=3079297 RepID=UPI002905ECF7|nr:Sir2 family NAD-dependent protein deacetylase [Roseobacter sp. HKCCA0434]